MVCWHGIEFIDMKNVDSMNDNIIKGDRDYFRIIASLVIIGAFLVVVMISFLSEWGVHPDEWDVKPCLDWGMTHWIWPDMRSKGLGDTYSWYGYTKVCNYTPYFLIAGKIASVFNQFEGLLTYFRMPNLLLMGLMLVVMLRGLKEKRYLMLAFGMCVQAWYIFAYVTADALDFVWAFLAVYMLADEDSYLWKTLNRTTFGINTIGRCILLGLLYGMILLGKPYYYATLALTFVILLLHLVKSSFDERNRLWKRYILILAVSGLVFAGRFGLDLHYYGTQKAEVKLEVAEKYASPDKKPSAPVEEQDVTWHMASKGYKVTDLFEYDEDWGKCSYRSFVSSRITTSGDDWYYVCMAVLYIVIYVWIGVSTFGSGGVVSGRKTNVIIFVTGTILSVGGVVASIMNSYLIDSQSQGRYLLPIALTTAYLGSRVPKVWKNKYFCGLVLCAACLSIIYFGLFDSRALIDLGYVRETFLGK